MEPDVTQLSYRSAAMPWMAPDYEEPKQDTETETNEDGSYITWRW